MPLFSDTASAIKSRFGFRTAASTSSSSEMSITATPDLYSKSAALKGTNRILGRTMSAGALDFDEDDGKSTSCNGTFEFREDPSFWKNHNVQIREDGKKGIYVEYLTELEGASSRDVITQILQGATNRKVAATNMNHASSRSHSVFTCTIESKWESQGVTHHRFARLNLVDLEGSERQKSSGAEGERLKEATNINKSLSTLGLVIMNLVNVSNGKSLHVPYKDSKLTFLLQDSLGGNAKTIIIANISPSSNCTLGTLSTLKFVQRAKYIKNHAIVNEDASGDVLAMRIQIQNLKKEVSRLRSLFNGEAESHENEGLAVSFPGSPGKWEGLHGLSSPFLSDRRMSQKKEYESSPCWSLQEREG